MDRYDRMEILSSLENFGKFLGSVTASERARADFHMPRPLLESTTQNCFHRDVKAQPAEQLKFVTGEQANIYLRVKNN